MEVVVLIAGVVFGALLKDAGPKYDAVIPDRCATFDARNDVENKGFCDRWLADHTITVRQSELKK